MRPLIHFVNPALLDSFTLPEICRSRIRALPVSLGLLLFGGIFLGSPTPSGATEIPAPVNCSVQPADDLWGLLVVPTDAPTGAASHTITVRNNSNVPVQNAIVVVTLAPQNSICGSTSLVGVTDQNGQVTLDLGGGGCASGIPLAGVIKANGITIRAYEHVKSPDSTGDLQVTLQDLVAFSSEFLGGPGDCHDYNNDGATGLPDLVIFGPPFSAGDSCAP